MVGKDATDLDLLCCGHAGPAELSGNIVRQVLHRAQCFFFAGGQFDKLEPKFCNLKSAENNLSFTEWF